MNDEMKTETMELCVTACEKFASNNEVNNRLKDLINYQLFKKIKKVKIGYYYTFKGRCSNDQRNSRQEIRPGLARDRRRRLRLRDHSRGEKSFIHVFRRHSGHSIMEMRIKKLLFTLCLLFFIFK